LLLIPILIALLACNFVVSAIPVLTPTAQATFTLTSDPLNATITGKLSYPSEFLPPLRVVLFSVTNGKAYFVDTAKGQGEYSIECPRERITWFLIFMKGLPEILGRRILIRLVEVPLLADIPRWCLAAWLLDAMITLFCPSQ
jgi:hypothetical protein